MKFVVFTLIFFINLKTFADGPECPSNLSGVVEEYRQIGSNVFGEVEVGNGYMVFNNIHGHEIGEIKAILAAPGVVEMDLIFVNEAFRGMGAQDEMYRRMLAMMGETSGTPIIRVNAMTSLSMTNQKVFLTALAQRANIAVDANLDERALETLLMNPPHLEAVMALPQSAFEAAFRMTPKARSMSRLGFETICDSANSFRLVREARAQKLRLQVDLCR